MRAMFEKWAASWGYAPFKRKNDGYADKCVQKVWRAWCFQSGQVTRRG